MNWNEVRKEFPVSKERVFLDHARVGVLPTRVRDAIAAFGKDACEQGTANYLKWMHTVEETRKSFAKLINAQSEEVAFIKNTSEGISIVANGIDWQEGDNVVLPDIEFPANVYPWMNLEKRGVEVRWVKAVRGRVPFEQITAQVNRRTRVVSVSSVEFNSGFRNDLERIGAFCKERKVYFCVDAIQSLGVLPMDVEAWHIDFLAADGHKWLLAPEGLGGFYISKRVLDEVQTAAVGWDSVVDAANYGDYDFTLLPDARRFEGGSFNTLGIHAFGEALSLFHEIGVEAIAERILYLGDRILERLRERKLKVLSSCEAGERSGIVCFALPGDLKAFAQFLAERKVTVSVRDSFIRLSPHCYNNEDDIDRFFEYVDEFLKN